MIISGSFIMLMSIIVTFTVQANPQKEGFYALYYETRSDAHAARKVSTISKNKDLLPGVLKKSETRKISTLSNLKKSTNNE